MRKFLLVKFKAVTVLCHGTVEIIQQIVNVRKLGNQRLAFIVIGTYGFQLAERMPHGKASAALRLITGKSMHPIDHLFYPFRIYQPPVSLFNLFVFLRV